MIDIFKRWFFHSKEYDIDDSQNPWAGLASYEDPETAERELKFCGRDDDSYDLARLIMGNVFVTLYGKSGIGKTSLLNAGVFPELREEQYTPVSIRLGMRNEEQPQSYQTMIADAIEIAIKRIETINVIEEQQDQQSIDFLWNYFVRHHFYDKNDEPTTPVIVFDQFEEVFRGHRDEAETLLRQLDYLNDKDHTLDSFEVNGLSYHYEQNFRFVVSIREDDLYRLEDSIDNCYLPALKRCRYRLHSLSEQGARDAILIPGEGLFKTTEQDTIVNAIIDKSRNANGSISTNIISLLCSRIFIDYKRSDTDHISPTLVDSFLKGNPFEQSYNEATRGFSNREKSYIEDHLVDSTGRRNSIPESDFLCQVKNGSKLLEGNSRIIQRVSTSSDGGCYRIELIHDSFCKPLAELKGKRERKRRLQWYALTIVIILICVCITAIIAHIANKNFGLEKKNTELNDSLLTALKHAEQERDAARNANLQKDSVLILLRQFIAQLNSSNQHLYLKERELSVAHQGFLTNHSLVLAEKANKLLDDGDSYLARLLALQALPPNLSYTIEAEGALRNASQNDNAILRGHTRKVNSAFFSPDGKHIVSASDDNTVRIWDAQTGKQIGSPLEEHIDKVLYATFSPDGKYIVSASEDNTVRIWDAHTGRQEGNPLKQNTFKSHSVSFSPDSKFIVSAFEDNTVRIWDAKTGQQIGSHLEGHTGTVHYAAFSPDGKFIVSASEDNTIRIWNAKTGELVGCPLYGHTGAVYSASFSPDSELIVSASADKTIRIWNAKTGELIGSPLCGHAGAVYCASFSPDGKFIASASEDHTVRIWDTQTGMQVSSPLLGHTGNVYSASFSPDGKYIVSASEDYMVRIWSVQNGRKIGSPIEEHSLSVQYATFSPDGKFIVSASADNTIRIWNTQTGLLVGNPLDKHTGTVYSASFSPDSKLVVSASADKTVRIWNAQTGQQLGKPLDKHNFWVRFASFSPDAKQIVSASSDKTVRVWDVQTGQCLHTLKHDDYVYSASFSPDGKYIISASADETIRIWDAQLGLQIMSLFKEHTGAVNSACFSPDGKFIVSASADKTVRIWNAQTGQQIGSPLEGHTNNVYSASFSPDGKFIVSASADKTIRLWDAKTGLCLQLMRGHMSDVNSATFSPDGQHIVSASRDGTICIWDVPPLQKLIDQTRERFKDRPLTPEERRKFYLE